MGAAILKNVTFSVKLLLILTTPNGVTVEAFNQLN
jgi:hypothetical protein